MKYLFTSESVTEGHPDKIADQISDSILDFYLESDKESKVACEVLINGNMVVISGEIKSKLNVSEETIKNICKKTILNIGYNDKKLGFDANTCKIIVDIGTQSEEISKGVEKPNEQQGAGDQGIMFGYACDETDEFMPLPIYLAHKLTKSLTDIRKNNIFEHLRPDGKSQVSVLYENGKPISVDTVLISTQHSEKITLEELKEKLIKYVIKPSLGNWYNENIKIIINPSGSFILGGPKGDCGLTGRKIIVDTYGGMGRHGGGCFSGKDSSKVDRSGAYMGRYVAKNIVANKLAKKCEVQISYAIGQAKPTSIYVNTFGTNKISEKEIEELVNKNFNFTPYGIIKTLDLKKPIYKKVSVYGHFGRNDLDLPWEKIIKL